VTSHKTPPEFFEKNKRRIELASRADTLTDDVQAELEELQAYAAEIIDEVFPLPLKDIKALETNMNGRSHDRPKTIKIAEIPPPESDDDE